MCNRKEMKQDMKIMKAYIKRKPLEIHVWINGAHTWVDMLEDEPLQLNDYMYRIKE